MSQCNTASPDDLRPEYDFSGAIRGKHHEQYRAGTNVVFLDSDVATVAPGTERARPPLSPKLLLRPH
jgi:hypothetical protein